MTKKVFWEDPYLTVLDTVVQSVTGSTVTLRETIFYARSGGQESDNGTIGGYPVIEAQKNGTGIQYVLPSDHTIQTGDSVRVEIDWDRRYRLMRHHFAAELILKLVYQEVGTLKKIGAHISDVPAKLEKFLLSEKISVKVKSASKYMQLHINRRPTKKYRGHQKAALFQRLI